MEDRIETMEQKPLFTKGTRVKVKSAEQLKNEFADEFEDNQINRGATFVSEMWKYCGDEVTIKTAWYDDCYGECYHLVDIPFTWNGWMFEEIIEQKEIPEFDIADLLIRC